MPTTGDPPAQRHSRTSMAAAEDIKPRVNEQCKAVLRALRRSRGGGLTDEQILQRSGLGPNTARPRRIDLTRMGLVRDSGRTRKTASGRPATVWVAAG
jgi:hypothetical protein